MKIIIPIKSAKEVQAMPEGKLKREDVGNVILQLTPDGHISMQIESVKTEAPEILPPVVYFDRYELTTALQALNTGLPYGAVRPLGAGAY